MDSTPNEDVNMPSSSDGSGLEPLKRVILCQPILNQIVDMWRMALAFGRSLVKYYAIHLIERHEVCKKS